MSADIYANPDEPEPVYLNMQRSRSFPSTTYARNPCYVGSSYHNAGFSCNVKRGTIVIYMLVLVICLESASLTMGGLVLYRILYAGDITQDQLPLTVSPTMFKQQLDQIKSQLGYMMSTISYSLPKELTNNLRSEVDRMGKDIDKLEILVLSSMLDLNMELTQNNSFSLSTGSKNGVCQQYLTALKKSIRDKNKKCPQGGTTNTDAKDTPTTRGFYP
ncbi:transmembrane protein [Paramyxoviridae sp. 1]|nr:transmembrane protein [Paramyxoviridae sp. 1]